ncbi:SET domain-containing protein [Calocera cornea HHB12733]|uniref:SET domain-containing protein n=1 Tax=Calocera cornea HHB12733 TaxID=1353952 RepID=A0A165D227_9BASI|nr:SET domain-containing protein [Calocera cornea HHB12733]
MPSLLEANALMLDPITSAEFCEIRQTPWAGRGMFAKKTIPASTVVLQSPEPIAYVILQPYRHEACDWCFAYDNGTRWPISYDVEDKKGKRGVAWFSSDECCDMWQERMGALGIEAWIALDQAMTTYRRARSKEKTTQPFLPPTTINKSLPIESEVEAIWSACADTANVILAARLVDEPSKAQRRLLREAQKLALSFIDEDDAFLLLSGVLSLERAGPFDQTLSEPAPPTWQALLELQPSVSLYLKNDSPIVRHVAAIHLLLCILPLPLLPYCTALNALRLFTRDACNSFGIRSQTHGSESEFLGYGVWPSASYFNHSCAPNLVKLSPGREWVFETSREILPDEELRISYLGDLAPHEMDVEERRKQLKLTWGFDCDCPLCLAQLQIK